MFWTILNCLWNMPASPQICGCFFLNLKTKAWKPNSSDENAGTFLFLASDQCFLALLSLLRTQQEDLVDFSCLLEDWHHWHNPKTDVFSILRLDLLPTDSWFGTSPAFPRAGNTCCARARPSWVLEGIHTPMLKNPNPDPSSRCLGALATVRAQISQVPQKAAGG